jgi:hypothetical protein
MRREEVEVGYQPSWSKITVSVCYLADVMYTNDDSTFYPHFPFFPMSKMLPLLFCIPPFYYSKLQLKNILSHS